MKLALSIASWSGDRWSMKCRRTLATCDGATRSMVSMPCGVITANVPRLSPGQSSRRTSPRSSMRETWCESLLRD